MIAAIMGRVDGNPLRALRHRRGLSQQEASAAVGVARATWSAWELGAREMKVTQVARIQTTFGLDDAALGELLRWAARVVER